MNRTTLFGAAALLALGAFGCASEDPASQEADATEIPSEFDFQLPGPGDEMERIDAMGVALTSTVLMNRDRDPLAKNAPPGGADNDNRYQAATPDVHKSLKTPAIFLHFLRSLHLYWRDHLKALGYEPCSKWALPPLKVVATPCTLQKLRMADGSEGPRVMDAVIPDYITVDIGKPLGFPNGRTPWEPISDKVVAMGFLKMGGKCPNGPCNIETFSAMPLQVPTNDRPFHEDTFPYLAEPWFYPPSADAPFWPTAARMDKAE
jgi:hypothetical protein